MLLLIFTSEKIYPAVKNKPLIMVHYMPWFQTSSTSGYWGWHWTMNHFNPDKIDQNGKREIASHYYPLTGPYDSQDKDILEYHVLLMKISGIDGVLVDWYGNENYNDYGIINTSTNATFNYIKKAKLSFAIVYEDQTIKNMISSGHINSSDAINYGRNAINYLQSTWFNTESYLKIDNRPVLLNFGPQYFTNGSDWITLFSNLTVTPLFFTEDNILSPAAAGAFPWPPMWKSNSNGILTETDLSNYLNQFYQKSNSWSYKIGSAFPGFNDIYKEAGGSSYGYLDSQNGVIFNSTLQYALDNNTDIIQLVTWNDYGEGTNIEPTLEYGYQYLERVQEIRKAFIDPAFDSRKENLLLPIRIYQLRKKNPVDTGINAALNRAFDLIVSGDINKATILIDSLATITDLQLNSSGKPYSLLLEQNYPNPFNPTTKIKYELPSDSFVTIKVFDVLGHEIKTLINSQQVLGYYEINFDGSSLPSGIYFYRIQAGNFVQTKKMILMK